MAETKIKTGKIKEKKLVEMFASETIKKSYAEKGHFVSSQKKDLLEKVSRHCEIEDLGNQVYEIKNVYQYTLPATFKKMNKSLYQYICPLLIKSLIDGHDENHKIDITLGRWAREINMVNNNYSFIKYNRSGLSSKINCSIDTIDDFYDRADDMIERYIINALDYMKASGLIIWRDVYRVNQEVTNDSCTIDENGNVYVDITIDSHQASKKEMEFYSTCVGIADKEANIKNASERYYSNKAQKFNEVLKRELYKKKINCIYKTYEAYYTNLDKCKFILSRFGNIDWDNLIKCFNDDFTNMITENAGKRFDKNPDKYIEYESKDNYQLSFRGLCELTIGKDAEYLNTNNGNQNYSLHVRTGYSKK